MNAASFTFNLNAPDFVPQQPKPAANPPKAGGVVDKPIVARTVTAPPALTSQEEKKEEPSPEVKPAIAEVREVPSTPSPQQELKIETPVPKPKLSVVRLLPETPTPVEENEKEEAVAEEKKEKKDEAEVKSSEPEKAKEVEEPKEKESEAPAASVTANSSAISTATSTATTADIPTAAAADSATATAAATAAPAPASVTAADTKAESQPPAETRPPEEATKAVKSPDAIQSPEPSVDKKDIGASPQPKEGSVASRVYTTVELMALRDKSPALDLVIQNKIREVIQIKSNFPGGKPKPGGRNTSGGGKAKPKRRPAGPELTAFEKKRQLIIGALNRLVEQNLKDVTDELVALDYEGDMKLYEELSSLIFEKSVNEPKFVVTFAEMCKLLDEKLKLPEQDGKAFRFKRLLLKKCQNVFMTGNGAVEESEKEALNSEEKELIEQAMYKKKKSYIGNIVFVTELYKQCLVPSKVIVEGCIVSLMKQIMKNDYTFIEPLHKLLMNVGCQLEKEMHDDEKKQKFKKQMDETYEDLKKLMQKKDPAMGKRDYFMILGVLEQRDKWLREARKSKVHGPTTPRPADGRVTVVRSVSLTRSPAASPSPSSSSSSSSPAAAAAASADSKPSSGSVDPESVKRLVSSAMEEYMNNKDPSSLYKYFDEEVAETPVSYVLMPELLKFVVDKNLSAADTETVAKLLCDYPKYKSADLPKASDELVEVLGNLEDATDKVISVFAAFMAIVLRHFDFTPSANLVDCLVKLKDYDPFCSVKDQKKFGAPALYFTRTLKVVKEHDVKEAQTMLSNAKDYLQVFNNKEQRDELFKLYEITELISG